MTSMKTLPPPPVEERPPEARPSALRGRRLTVRFLIAALLVLAMVVAYDAFVGIEASDPWAFWAVVPLGVVLSFIVAGWVTALLFYDPDTQE